MADNKRVIVFLKDHKFVGSQVGTVTIPTKTVLFCEYNPDTGNYDFDYEGKPSSILVCDIVLMIDCNIIEVFNEADYIKRNINPNPMSHWDSAIVEMEVELELLIDQVVKSGGN